MSDTITIGRKEALQEDANRARTALARGDYHGGIEALERLIEAATTSVDLNELPTLVAEEWRRLVEEYAAARDRVSTYDWVLSGGGEAPTIDDAVTAAMLRIAA